MRIKRFGVEQWMNEYETRCDWNLAETCVESLTVARAAADGGQAATRCSRTSCCRCKLTYGAIEGIRTPARRRRRRSTTSKTRTTSMITPRRDRRERPVHADAGRARRPGRLGGADLPAALLDPREPRRRRRRSSGCARSKGSCPTSTTSRALPAARTKLIALSNPNNPTGALMDRAYLEQVVEIAASAARTCCATRSTAAPTRRATASPPRSPTCTSSGISTGSMSKAFSLAGLRLGWIVGAGGR